LSSAIPMTLRRSSSLWPRQQQFEVDMGKVAYLMNVSLDGFVETPDHSLDWTKGRR
jgi:hypothetical protein